MGLPYSLKLNFCWFQVTFGKILYDVKALYFYKCFLIVKRSFLFGCSEIMIVAFLYSGCEVKSDLCC